MVTVKKNFEQACKSDSLLDRAYLYLEDGDRKNALTYFEKVLDKNARSPFAYLGKLVISMNMDDLYDLRRFEKSYTDHPDFVKALRFAEGELHDALQALADGRDRAEATYNKAVEIEKDASTIIQLFDAYKLFCEVDSFADAEDRANTIFEAAPVVKFYHEKGLDKMRKLIDASNKFKVEMEQKIQSLNLGINMGKVMISELNASIPQKTAERNSLGIFKGKRKRELTAEIESDTKRLASLENELREHEVALQKATAELTKCKITLILEQFLPKKDDANNNLDVFASLHEDYEITEYDSDKQPLRLLKNTSILATVAKAPAALYAMLNDESAMKIINASQKSAAAVGQSTVFMGIAAIAMSAVEKCDKLLPYLPTKQRIAQQLKNSQTVTFGVFPKDGKDPYDSIVPLPGTPYVRSGDPVQWLKIAEQGSKICLIATRILTSRSYHPFEHTGYDSLTWEKSELRQWMNTSMLSTLFTDEERSLLCPLSNDKTADIDYAVLPDVNQVKQCKDHLPRMSKESNHNLWVNGPIDITFYNKSLLVSPPVYSLHYYEPFRKLYSNNCGIVPLIWIDLA
ncbi:MAG: hypothetical protein E7350_01200 [Clostridiales bacterium]|nr:hypothetical protein [Clostridiales bacterium]